MWSHEAHHDQQHENGRSVCLTQYTVQHHRRVTWEGEIGHYSSTSIINSCRCSTNLFFNWIATYRIRRKIVKAVLCAELLPDWVQCFGLSHQEPCSLHGCTSNRAWPTVYSLQWWQSVYGYVFALCFITLEARDQLQDWSWWLAPSTTIRMSTLKRLFIPCNDLHTTNEQKVIIDTISESHVTWSILKAI